MNADLDLKASILGQLGVARATDGVHFVTALEVEEDDADAGFTLQTGLKGAEHHFATPIRIEADVGGLKQVKIRAVPLVGFGKPPFTKHGAGAVWRDDFAVLRVCGWQ